MHLLHYRKIRAVFVLGSLAARDPLPDRRRRRRRTKEKTTGPSLASRDAPCSSFLVAIFSFLQGGSTIYTEGEIDRNFYLINHGEVSLEVEGAVPKKTGGNRRWGRWAQPRVCVCSAGFHTAIQQHLRARVCV